MQPDGKIKSGGDAVAPAQDRCPRCGGSFHCGMRDAAPCACTGIVLSARLQQQLRERYSGCLCLRCLGELATAQAHPRVDPRAARRGRTCA
jgi:hypothetical protein